MSVSLKDTDIAFLLKRLALQNSTLELEEQVEILSDEEKDLASDEEIVEQITYEILVDDEENEFFDTSPNLGDVELRVCVEESFLVKDESSLDLKALQDPKNWKQFEVKPKKAPKRRASNNNKKPSKKVKSEPVPKKKRKRLVKESKDDSVSEDDLFGALFGSEGEEENGLSPKKEVYNLSDGDSEEERRQKRRSGRLESSRERRKKRAKRRKEKLKGSPQKKEKKSEPKQWDALHSTVQDEWDPEDDFKNLANLEWERDPQDNDVVFESSYIPTQQIASRPTSKFAERLKRRDAERAREREEERKQKKKLIEQRRQEEKRKREELLLRREVLRKQQEIEEELQREKLELQKKAMNGEGAPGKEVPRTAEGEGSFPHVPTPEGSFLLAAPPGVPGMPLVPQHYPPYGQDYLVPGYPNPQPQLFPPHLQHPPAQYTAPQPSTTSEPTQQKEQKQRRHSSSSTDSRKRKRHSSSSASSRSSSSNKKRRHSTGSKRPSKSSRSQKHKKKKPPVKRDTTVSAVAEKKRKSSFKERVGKLVVRILQRYYKQGRIKTKEDFKHVSRAFTHKIISKEAQRKKHKWHMDKKVATKIKEFIDSYFKRHEFYERKPQKITNNTSEKQDNTVAKETENVENKTEEQENEPKKVSEETLNDDLLGEYGLLPEHSNHVPDPENSSEHQRSQEIQQTTQQPHQQSTKEQEKQQSQTKIEQGRQQQQSHKTDEAQKDSSMVDDYTSSPDSPSSSPDSSPTPGSKPEITDAMLNDDLLGECGLLPQQTEEDMLNNDLLGEVGLSVTVTKTTVTNTKVVKTHNDNNVDTHKTHEELMNEDLLGESGVLGEETEEKAEGSLDEDLYKDLGFGL